MAKNSRQKVPKSDFQSQFSTSKIIRIFIKKDFDEKGEEEVLHCTYIGKLFIMSMAFDKTFLIHAMIALITKMALIFS